MLLEVSSAMTEQVEALQRLDEDRRALTSHVASKPEPTLP
jgi:hypothetical protein